MFTLNLELQLSFLCKIALILSHILPYLLLPVLNATDMKYPDQQKTLELLSNGIKTSNKTVENTIIRMIW
jgi:hypothetical protein